MISYIYPNESIISEIAVPVPDTVHVITRLFSTGVVGDIIRSGTAVFIGGTYTYRGCMCISYSIL